MKIGILGGGQLARMLALSGYHLGMDFICIDPKKDCSAKKVCSVIHSDFNPTDETISHLYTDACVTYETENLPLDFMSSISNQYKLLPDINILRVTQDRLYEKELFNELKIPTTQYSQVETWDDFKKFLDRIHFPLVLKTRRFGYDGKGQMITHNINEARQAFELMRDHSLIVEEFIPYDFEVSLISVRNAIGDIAFYPLTLNHHQNGILRISEAPYVNDALQNKAKKYATAVLEKFNYIGTMTIEFFCINDAIIANEIAPRVHNSGHWTIEGADTSQFENHLRAIAGLPLGSTEAKGFSAMINIIGQEPKRRDKLLAIPGLHFHTYEKEAMPNRKLGHLTINTKTKQELDLKIKKTMNYLAEK